MTPCCNLVLSLWLTKSFVYLFETVLGSFKDFLFSYLCLRSLAVQRPFLKPQRDGQFHYEWRTIQTVSQDTMTCHWWGHIEISTFHKHLAPTACGQHIPIKGMVRSNWHFTKIEDGGLLRHGVEAKVDIWLYEVVLTSQTEEEERDGFPRWKSGMVLWIRNFRQCLHHHQVGMWVGEK